MALARLRGPCYLNTNHHDHRIRAKKQRKDMGKYSFVNTTIKLWNQLPAEALATFPCKSHIFRKRVRKGIISEKWRVFEAWWQNIQKCMDMKNGEWSEVKWWSWMKCIIIDLYLRSCMQYIVPFSFASIYFLITHLTFFNILFMFVFYFV